MAHEPELPVMKEPATSARPAFSPHAIHLIRTAQQMNLQLSQMADAKASLLMGATFVVFTIAVGQTRGGAMPLSLAVLAFSAFISAMCAVFAVLPAVSGPSSARLVDNRANKLFFGFFAHQEEGEWTESILDELHADETVFRTMLHDIYQNGQILQRKKYRYLAYAYKAFMAGLCLTVIVFAGEQAVRYLGAT